ncbi:MAG: hypothetical protein KJZ87_24510, partial [Thermoguttaceae bacterium]|nr:hypothetical protein [Thermoguttaceae bacterium]
MNRTTWTAAAGLLILALTAGSRSAAAQCHGSAGHSGHAPDHATAAQHDRSGPGQPAHRQTPVEVRPQHGGQVAAIEPHVFEVVYLPQEVRVYLFDMYRRPLSVAGVEGEVVFTVAADGRQFRYPLAPAAPPAVPGAADYLRLPLDLSGVAPGQVEARFHFTRLPHGIVSPPDFVQQVVL